MGTYVRIKLWGEEDTLMRGALDAAFAEVDRIEALTSRFNAQSEVSALNRNHETVSGELAELVRRTLKVSRLSRGAFDLTVSALLDLWGFYDTTDAEPRLPSRDEIAEALACVDYRALEVSGDTVRFHPPKSADASLDVSGAAKGYAVDRAVETLRRKGVKTGLVDAGGDIACFGAKRGGFSIGIRHPRKQRLLGVIVVDSGAVATSGDYENFFEVEGVRYHHIMDPATGMPARGAVSATVIAPSALAADAWATALFVMGREGIAVLDSLEGLEALLVLEDGSIVKTSGFPELKAP